VPDAIIAARSLVKVFRTPARYPGRFGSLRTLLTRKYNVKRGFVASPGKASTVIPRSTLP